MLTATMCYFNALKMKTKSTAIIEALEFKKDYRYLMLIGKDDINYHQFIG